MISMSSAMGVDKIVVVCCICLLLVTQAAGSTANISVHLYGSLDTTVCASRL